MYAVDTRTKNIYENVIGIRIETRTGTTYDDDCGSDIYYDYYVVVIETKNGKFDVKIFGDKYRASKYIDKYIKVVSTRNDVNRVLGIKTENNISVSCIHKNDVSADNKKEILNTLFEIMDEIIEKINKFDEADDIEQLVMKYNELKSKF